MTPYYEHAGITIYHGDCREILPEISSVGVVVTDPPYTFGLASTAQEGKAGGWGDLMNNSLFFGAWLGECRRLVSNSGGAAWVFNSWRSMPVLARAAYEIRWPITSLMVWDKQWIGPGGMVGLRPSYELVALFAAAGFQVTDRGTPDIWRCQWASQRPHGHAAEKPQALMQRLILAGGDGVVLDPFLGSGTTIAAAAHLGRSAIGIEIEKRYCEIAANRLEQEVLPLYVEPAPDPQQGSLHDAAGSDVIEDMKNEAPVTA